MKEKKNTNKASLSWRLKDYRDAGEVPPECVIRGKTEGEIMDEEAIAEWIADELQALTVLEEEYPDKFQEHFEIYLLDLEYLCSLDKITDEELIELGKRENIGFGKRESK